MRAGRVRVVGIDAWQSAKPIRYRLVSWRPNLPVMRGRLAENQELVMPPIPTPNCDLHIIGSDGLVLAQASVRKLLTQPGVPQVEVPEPTEMTFRVHDSSVGAPIEGAEILSEAGGLTGLVSIGRTNREGLFTSALPSSRHSFVARAPLYMLGPFRGDPADRTCLLKAGTQLAGRVLVKRGEPAGGLGLWIDGVKVVPLGKGRELSGCWRSTRADAEGRYNLPSLCADQTTIYGVMTDANVRALPGLWRRGMHPVIFGLIQPSRAGMSTKDISLDALCPVDFEIKDPNGAGADRATILLWRKSQSVLDLRHPVFRTDRRGCLRMLFPPMRDTMIAVRSRNGWFVGEIEVQSGSDRAVVPVSISLCPTVSIRGRIVDQDGRAVPGASVGARPVGRTWTEPKWGGGDSRAHTRDRNSVRVVEPTKLSRRLWTLSRIDPVSRARTAADGRFDIGVPTAFGRYELRGTVMRRGVRLRLSGTFDASSDEEIEIVLDG